MTPIEFVVVCSLSFSTWGWFPPGYTHTNQTVLTNSIAQCKKLGNDRGSWLSPFYNIRAWPKEKNRLQWECGVDLKDCEKIDGFIFPDFTR